MATYYPSYQYNVNPMPNYGSNTATGQVPGQIGVPNVAAQLGQQIPNLGALNSSIFGNLLSESQGQIPQADQNFMQDQAAARAVAAGMPGTNIMPGTLEGNSAARNLGLLQYQLQQQASQQYPSLVGAVSGTQTVPAQTQIGVAEQNAVNASAPNPASAQSYAQQLYNQYLQSARGPGGGTGGGRGPTSGTGTYGMEDPLNLNAGGAGGNTGDTFDLGGGSIAAFGGMGQSWDDMFNNFVAPTQTVGSPLYYSGANSGVGPQSAEELDVWNQIG